NEGYTRMSGWSESEAVGRTSVDLGLWIDVEQRKRLFEELSTSGVSRELETTFHKRGGSEFHCSLTSRLFTVGEGKFFLTVARDITERKRNENLRAALYRIAQSAGCSGSLQELLGEVHRIIADLMPVPNFYIALYDEARSIFHFPYAVDEHDELPSVPTDLEGSLTKYVFRTGKALAVDEPGFQELVRAGEVREMGAPCDSWIGVPLKTQDRTVGVLAAQCYTPTVRYEAAHLELLTFVSTQIAHAIQRTQGEEALRGAQRARPVRAQAARGAVASRGPHGLGGNARCRRGARNQQSARLCDRESRDGRRRAAAGERVGRGIDQGCAGRRGAGPPHRARLEDFLPRRRAAARPRGRASRAGSVGEHGRKRDPPPRTAGARVRHGRAAHRRQRGAPRPGGAE